MHCPWEPRNKTYVYTYDNAGNRTSKKTYAYTTGTLGTATATQTLTYSTGAWGDQLANTTYDAIGNPSMYNIYATTWNGRLLTGMVMNGGLSTCYFTYNDEGIRTSKTVQGVKHTYILEGSRIVGEQFGVHYLIYLYDESGAPIGLQHRTSFYAAGVFDTYYFEKNVFGDVIGVYTADGTPIGTYKYDAWGNCTRVVNTNATTAQKYVFNTLNPFRYRGYYYDVDSQLYYLQSRYYDPATGRFLNADGYINANGDLLGYNMYAYCGNNPVMNTDPTGEIPVHLIIGGVIGGLVGGISAAVSGGDVFDIVLGTIGGTVGGVLTASGVGVLGQMLGSAAISMTTNALQQGINIIQGEAESFDAVDMLIDGSVSLVCGAIGGNGASFGNTSGINSSGKQLIKNITKNKKGIMNSMKTYSKYAHRQGGDFVLSALGESSAINTIGSAVVVGKNHIMPYFERWWG